MKLHTGQGGKGSFGKDVILVSTSVKCSFGRDVMLQTIQEERVV